MNMTMKIKDIKIKRFENPRIGLIKDKLSLGTNKKYILRKMKGGKL